MVAGTPTGKVLLRSRCQVLGCGCYMLVLAVRNGTLMMWAQGGQPRAWRVRGESAGHVALHDTSVWAWLWVCSRRLSVGRRVHGGERQRWRWRCTRMT